MLPALHTPPVQNCWERPPRIQVEGGTPLSRGYVAAFLSHVQVSSASYMTSRTFFSDREMLAEGYKCYFRLRTAASVYKEDSNWAATASGLELEASRLARGLITWQSKMKNTASP